MEPSSHFLLTHVVDGKTRVSMARRPRRATALPLPPVAGGVRPPPRPRSVLELPSHVTRSLTVTPLPGGSPLLEAGVPVLAIGASGSLSVSDPGRGSVDESRALEATLSRLGELSALTREADRRRRRRAGPRPRLPPPVMTAATEFALRRRERREDAEEFARRHLENWEKLQPWLREKEAQRLTAPTRLLRRMQSAARGDLLSVSRRAQHFWQGELNKPGTPPKPVLDPSAIEPTRGGDGDIPMSLRVPPALHLDGGVHNSAWGGADLACITVGWVDPCISGSRMGTHMTRVQLQHRPASAVGAYAATVAVQIAAAVAPTDDVTMLATAAANMAVVFLARAVEKAAGDGGGGTPRLPGASALVADSQAPKRSRRQQMAARAAAAALELARGAAEEAGRRQQQQQKQQEQEQEEEQEEEGGGPRPSPSSTASTPTAVACDASTAPRLRDWGAASLATSAAAAAAAGVTPYDWEFPSLVTAISSSGRQEGMALVSEQAGESVPSSAGAGSSPPHAERLRPMQWSLSQLGPSGGGDEAGVLLLPTRLELEGLAPSG
jgi:hypothetical protein